MNARARQESPASRPAVVAELAQMSQERRSWRRRLEWLRGQLARPEVRRDEDRLAYFATYLRLVGTGALPCAEDGGHHRPSQHAALALDIEQSLLGGEPRPAPGLTRRIVRWLPSYDAPFRRSEPLTRIRDIAHRNDIPRALKEEIKHTLQNKLHRSAGPEDLETSRRLLDRVNREPERYPASFVVELRRFHAELEDFFNARTLDSDLERIAGELAPETGRLCLELRGSIADPRDDAAKLERELVLALELRRALAPAFTRVGEPHSQRLRLIDVKLEERTFVLLSQLTTAFERGGEAPQAARTLATAVEHIALGGVLEEPCRALGEALAHHAGAPAADDREDRLILRALFDQGKWLMTRLIDEVFASFSRRVEELGRALGIDPDRVAFYAEGEIRGSLAYPTSRLLELAAERVARDLDAPPWDAVVPGTASGRLVSLDSLAELPPGPGPWLVALRRATGDEDIPGAVRGLLVLHDLPILSHLAIRARQRRVVLAVLRAGGDLPRELEGKEAHVRVTTGGLELAGGAAEPTASEGPLEAARPSPTVSAVLARFSDELRVVALGDGARDTGGPKADAARRLLELSREPDAGFSSPAGWVVPFGVMEACLRAARLEDEFTARRAELASAPDPELPHRCQRLRDLVRGVPIPAQLSAALASTVSGHGRLVARSSSNLEDIAGFSAAGLYDSVIGVRPDELGAAVTRVWASLFSERAVRARRAAGVDETVIAMATLIQPLLASELSFILFTRSPLDPSGEDAYVEVAVGQGEILCSATGEGTPFRLRVSRRTGGSELLAFASYPEALEVDESGALARRPVRYAGVPFFTSREERQRWGSRFAMLAQRLEDAFSAPQDVEGAIVADTPFVVQSRPAVVA